MDAFNILFFEMVKGIIMSAIGSSATLPPSNSPRTEAVCSPNRNLSDAFEVYSKAVKFFFDFSKQMELKQKISQEDKVKWAQLELDATDAKNAYEKLAAAEGGKTV